MNKATLIAELNREHGQWEELLAAIGGARMEQPAWSIKDIVAHLTGWRRRTVGRLQAALPGEPEPEPPWPAQLQTDSERSPSAPRRERSIKKRTSGGSPIGAMAAKGHGPTRSSWGIACGRICRATSSFERPARAINARRE